MVSSLSSTFENDTMTLPALTDERLDLDIAVDAMRIDTERQRLEGFIPHASSSEPTRTGPRL